MRLVVLGLSLSSSWGNGHATTWRALLRGLADLGHEIVFLERDMPWYAENRDLEDPDFCRLAFYADLAELERMHTPTIRAADAVILGSYLPDGIEIGHWVCDRATAPVAFYDIDTPVTCATLRRGQCGYLDRPLARRFDLYLSFSGGPLLATLEQEFGVAMPRPLYCSVDPTAYRPVAVERRWMLGYLGTYSADRQPKLEALLVEPARRLGDDSFVVAGPQYPPETPWPPNVERINHLPPARHPAFYAAQRFTLNVTRRDMTDAGFSPSVRLFEAAACGVPVISDPWPGIETLFRPGEEILLAEDTGEMLDLLAGIPEERRDAIGERARRRVLDAHSGIARARELLDHLAKRPSRAGAFGSPPIGHVA